MLSNVHISVGRRRHQRSLLMLGLLAGATLVGTLQTAAFSQQPADKPIPEKQQDKPPGTPPAPEDASPPPGNDDAPKTPATDEPKLKRLSPTENVWIDAKRKLVVIDATVVLREGLLEMFACPKGTKEHESVLAVAGKASTVHAALLALGAKAGSPVKFQPEYQPAKGETIEILVLWTDAAGKRHTEDARSWVREFKTKKELKAQWVFAGSSFWTNPQDNKQYYQGDTGDFICVSNFPTATLDLPLNSSQSNDDLLYEAFTEHIPPVGTPVRLVLRRTGK